MDIPYGNDVGVVYCVIFSPCPSLPLSLAPGTREIDMAGILLVTFNLRERDREREGEGQKMRLKPHTGLVQVDQVPIHLPLYTTDRDIRDSFC